jgi:uncharacterized protein (DUF1810 family)
MSNHDSDTFNLSRFVEAQDQDYGRALSELKAGRKRTHWIWYILPQFAGLGSSRMSSTYAIRSLEEVRGYLAHPILGPRLQHCVTTLNSLTGRSALQMLGEVDAAKYRSSLTLFAEVAGPDSLFSAGLKRYYQSQPDLMTLSLISTARGVQ